MATAIGVRFKKAGKVYYFDPAEIWPIPGSNVVVETTRGIEMGEVVTGAREIDETKLASPLKRVIRIATADDEERALTIAQKEEEAFKICQKEIARHKLEMRLVSVEITFDYSKIIFYFTAESRVDFRELVRDLASTFKMRIELRQIGVRDEAKMLGGLGPCGRPICCAAFLPDFQPVSIKMAKEQSLSLNPNKISGQCGRLMCCLKYEQDYYEETLRRLPKVGRDIMTADGAGVVVEISPVREIVKVRIHLPDDTFDVREYGINEVRRLEADEDAAVREEPKAKAAPKADKAEDEEAPKRRYPLRKNLNRVSADDFLEKLNTSDAPGETNEPPRRKREGRRPRGKR